MDLSLLLRAVQASSQSLSSQESNTFRDAPIGSGDGCLGGRVGTCREPPFMPLFWASQTSGADLEMGRHASKEKAPSLTEEEPAEAKGSETARGGG